MASGRPARSWPGRRLPGQAYMFYAKAARGRNGVFTPSSVSPRLRQKLRCPLCGNSMPGTIFASYDSMRQCNPVPIGFAP